MLLLKHCWRKRVLLKRGEMQVGTPEWMKDRPEYKYVINGFAPLCFGNARTKPLEPQKAAPKGRH